MQLLLLGLLSCLAISSATAENRHLLGEKECTYGPTYWCQNLTTAAGCHATKHCVQTHWIYKKYPEDTTSICDTCKNMVKQARDQLLSNETQEEIKEVFEGSCALLPLKIIVKECDKIADEFIPDLIDTLASEMDPQTVCAVAGLCNSQRVHDLLAASEAETALKPVSNTKCSKCHSAMDLIVSKFAALSDEQFLEFLLKICGRLNSYSDACSSAVFSHFQDIFSYVKQNLNSKDVCTLSGECSENFHSHAVEITPQSNIGYVQLRNEKEDMPCDLCKQLVTHLKEIMVANTTESEFKQVLEGICKQAKAPYNKECEEFVDTYYAEIYNDVTKALDPSAACELIGICPAKNDQVGGLIAPLLPVESIEMASTLTSQLTHQTIPRDDIVIRVIKAQPEKQTPLSASEMQLPIDLLVPPHQQVYNEEVCIFCQYFLHFVQEKISDPVVEDDIKKVIDTACSKLPSSVNQTCVEFVDTYEPALIAILAQKIDPSQVCPLLKACPSSSEEVKDVDIFRTAQSSSSCPLCLYAVTELESMIKGKKTKEEIKKDLDKVCNHLSSNLKAECTDFINTYSDELVEMLIADFKPQEVCVYLKLCTDDTPVSNHEQVESVEEEMFGGDIETNSIYDDTINGHPVSILHDEKCILCEFILKEIDDQLKNKKNQDEIKTLVHDICKVMPGSVKESCNNFVNQYADAVIILLEEAMDPSQVCTYLRFCGKAQHPLDLVKDEVSRCGVCRTTAQFLRSIVKNPKIIDQNLEHVFEKTCRGMPSEMKKTCESLINHRGLELLTLVGQGKRSADAACHTLSYCNAPDQVVIN